MVRSLGIELDGCSLAVDQAAATTSVLGLSQGALAALMAPNSCPVVMPVLYALPAVSQPSLLIPFYPHYCALWLLR